MSPHLLVTVSAHGFGHFAQSALVINALRRLRPEVRVTLRSRLPEHLIRDRIDGQIDIIPEVADFGMLMDSALDVQRETTFEKYQRLHSHWQQNIDEEAARLRSLNADLLLANVPYLSLAAAAQIKLSSVALCSLNWADIFWDYFAEHEGAASIHAQMCEAYDQAQAFLRPQPSMAMPHFNNTRDIGPLAMLGENRREQLNQHWQLSGEEKLILIVPGGITTQMPVNDWPQVDGLRWVVTWPMQSTRSDVLNSADAGMNFSDLLCSCDVVLTKPGYGTAAETICNDKPMLFVKRGDWAEEPFIVDWLLQHGRVREVSREQFFHGELIEDLQAVLQLPPRPVPEANGAEQAACYLAELLG